MTADWHLRTGKPRCRVDEDWMETQEKAISFVIQAAKDKDASICIVGDIFDSATDHIFILNFFLGMVLNCGVDFYLLGGNHDFLYHNIDYSKRSLFGALFPIMESKKTNLYNIIEGSYFPCNILFIHELVFSDEGKAPPGSKYYLASDLLKTFQEAKYIFTGDNHTSFIYNKDNRYVVNPGCLIRQAADFKDYQPVIYYVNTDKEIIETIPVPDDAELVDDEYLVQVKKRDERISAFVSSLKEKGKISLSFKDNLMKKIETVDDATKQIILTLLEEIKS
jgi:DNA repair exonuclease SbcCD nuclease subunit